jgi:hypothetical protein
VRPPTSAEYHGTSADSSPSHRSSEISRLPSLRMAPTSLLDVGAPVRAYNILMSWQHHYYGANYLHYLTKSIYRRVRVFDSDRFRLNFTGILDGLRAELGFKLRFPALRRNLAKWPIGADLNDLEPGGWFLMLASLASGLTFGGEALRMALELRGIARRGCQDAIE